MFKLDPSSSNCNYTYKTDSFELLLQHKKATVVSGRNYIKEKDAYWNFPTNIFANQQGVASRVQEIHAKLVKNILNPFLYERNSNAFLESNITSVEFYTVAGNKIPVNLSSSSTYIDYREPYNLTQGYNAESLRCMSWNNSAYQFANDGTCTYSMIWDVIPCSTCDQWSLINTTVSICRCKHLSRFGVVFQ